MSAYLKLVSKMGLGQTLKQMNDGVAYSSKSSVCTARTIPAQADYKVEIHYS